MIKKKGGENMLPEGLASAVTDWFRENGRVLPWRVGRDPYRIWISEIMLQQTRIEAVIPYYYRFLERIPSVSELAVCPEEVLLKLWEGLGYYSRARNLKKAAEKICAYYGGEVPRTATELEKLPGIGAYTAGAIASIAFGEPAPAVDGNVLRVLTRVMGDESDIAFPATKKRITELLRAIYPTGEEAALLTEGIMEIGERVCIPGGVPLCTVCPLKELCRAGKEGTWSSIPVKSAKKPRKMVEMTVLLLSCGDRFALRQRPETGLLSRMWEFYHVPGHLGEAAVFAHLEEAGFAPESVEILGSARHIFTHLEWEMKGYFCKVNCPSPQVEWKTVEEIRGECALPGAFRFFKEHLERE